MNNNNLRVKLLTLLTLTILSLAFSQNDSKTVIAVIDYDFGQPVIGQLKLEWCLADIVSEKEKFIKRNVGNRGQCIAKTEQLDFQERKLTSYVGSTRLELVKTQNYQICLLAQDLPSRAGLYISCQTLTNATNTRLSFSTDTLVAWAPKPNIIPGCFLNAISIIPQSSKMATETDNRINKLLELWNVQSPESSSLKEAPSALPQQDTKTNPTYVRTLEILLKNLEETNLISTECSDQVNKIKLLDNLALENILSQLNLMP